MSLQGENGSQEVLRMQDAEARRCAQTVFNRPLVLEAGAGTGKTTTLTARIVAWCMGPGWALAQKGEPGATAEADRIAAQILTRVVAITFTEAAAAEMAARIGEAFASIERGDIPVGLLAETLPPSLQESQMRARALLGALDHLFVRTIHAFCLNLLARAPLEAGLHPDFSVDAEGLLRDELIREVLERELKVAYASPANPHFLALAVNGVGPQEIHEALDRLTESATPAQALDEDPFSPERIREVRNALLESINAFREAEADRLSGAGRRSAVTREVLRCLVITQGCLETMSCSSLADVQDLCRLVQQSWSESALERLKKWQMGNFNASESKWLGDAADILPQRVARLRRLISHLMCMDPEFLDHARRALQPLLLEVQREMRARGVQTFGGLLLDARDLIARNPHLRKRMQQDTDQLLVDEFQDTDPIQCDIIRMIALEGPKEGRPGLFIVGDPKQSIYGWRDADLRAYQAFLSHVLREGGQLHRLMVNFRSTPVILKEVQRVILPVMRERPGLQPAFQPLVPCPDLEKSPGFARKPRAPIEYWVSWSWDDQHKVVSPRPSSEEATELEAEALAQDILALRNQHAVAWQDVGVLLRNTGDLDTYLSAFRREGIPYAVTRDKSYYQRREIIEVAALLRCVLDPNDHLAMLTLLRSAMVGVPDAALIPLWNREFPALVTELRGPSREQMDRIRAVVTEAAAALPSDIPKIERIAGWDKGLIAALEALAALRESFEKDPPDVFVEAMRTLLLVEPTEAARYLGAFRVANLEQFFRGLLEAIEESGGDPQAILRSLRKSVAQAREAEEGRPKEAAENAVQVMTIHKAKGLDFEHVYLMQAHKGSAGDTAQETRMDVHEGRREYTLFGYPTLRFYEIEARRQAVAASELVRTLYVAMTRAKDRLVLAGRWPWPTTPKPPQGAAAHMDLLQWRALEPPALAELAEKMTGHVALAHVDAAGAHWIFPAIGPPEAQAIQAPSTATGLSSPEQVARAAERIADFQREASARMARPLRGAASEEAHEALREFFEERLLSAGIEAEPSIMAPWETLSGDGRRLAMAIGAAVHRAMETLDLNEDPSEQIEGLIGILPRYLRPLVRSDEMDQAVSRSRGLLERMARGPLLGKLFSLRDHIVGRELPVLLPPPEGADGPVGFVSGSIDLVYRDPDTGEVVVADYKTDEVVDPVDIAERSHAYALQGTAYVRAIRESLGLEQEPRFELWFLHANHIEVVPTAVE